jgi:hypothetical protein
MTQDKDMKAAVRARMAKTGESYAAARRQLLAKGATDAPAPADRAVTLVRLQVVDDDLVFEGTPRHIVHRMQTLCFGAKFLSMRDFLAWSIGNVGRHGQVDEIRVDGRSGVDAMCRSFLDEMIRIGLAREL